MFVCSHFPVEMLCSGALPKNKGFRTQIQEAKVVGGVRDLQITNTQQKLGVNKSVWRDGEWGEFTEEYTKPQQASSMLHSNTLLWQCFLLPLVLCYFNNGKHSIIRPLVLQRTSVVMSVLNLNGLSLSTEWLYGIHLELVKSPLVSCLKWNNRSLDLV